MSLLYSRQRLATADPRPFGSLTDEKLLSAIEANSKARSILLNVRPRGIDRRTDTALGECIVDLHKIAAALDAEADRRRSRQGGAA